MVPLFAFEGYAEGAARPFHNRLSRLAKKGLLTAFLLALGGALPAQIKAADIKPKRAPLAVGLAFDESGRLWRVQVVDGRLVVDVSKDHGLHFSQSTPVASATEPIAADGELRPEIAIGANGTIHVAWTSPLPVPYAGNIRFARSIDGGKTFELPVTVNDNSEAITHRFQSLQVMPDGRIALVWIDKRDLAEAKRAGGNYRGAALYYAVSDDSGGTFAPNRKLADHSCECCRIGLAADVDGTPVAFWRHVFDGGIRDFALARFDQAAQRASEDGWRIDACPHHGGDLAIDARGGRHLVWFTGAEGKAGLYYRRMDGERATAPLAFGDSEAQAGHPAVLVRGERVFVAWREFDGRQNRIRVMTSADRGANWSSPSTAATSVGATDYPLLLGGRGQAWLAWNTADEGFRLFALGAAE